MALAKDKEAYQLALFELTENANDTHANLWSSLGVRLPTGECALPVVLRFLEGKAVVYRTNSNEGALKPGDVVNAISGVPVASLFEKVVRYYADSNEAARRRDVAQYLSHGACGRCLSRSPAVEKLKRYLQSVSEISLRLRHTICRETPSATVAGGRVCQTFRNQSGRSPRVFRASERYEGTYRRYP